jgi:thiamine-phosphate pyrophosphorylase
VRTSFGKWRVIDFTLYLITDRKLFRDRASLYTAIEEAMKAGIKAVQLREKDLGIRELLAMAYKMREITGRYGAKLFINDRVDVALAVGADGVHLGTESMPVRAVRKILGGSMMIGSSTHSTAEAAIAADEGADFVTLGPVYETPSKMRYGAPLGCGVIRAATKRLSVPVFAIGGIKAERVDEVREAGAYGIALISAILTARNIQSSAEEFVRLLK